MKESSTYQAILEEGRAEGRIEGTVAERHKMDAAIFGRRRLWAAGPLAAAAIERINDLPQLEEDAPAGADGGRLVQDVLGRPLGRRDARGRGRSVG